MVKKTNKEKSKILVYFFVIVLILIALKFLLFKITPEKIEIRTEKENFQILDDRVLVDMQLPAVDNEGKGVATQLQIEANPGTGRTLVDIDSLLFWADTQHSIRIARLVASKLSKIDIETVDLIYSVKANASVVGGESAGAALAIATIAVIEKKTISPNVMITGAINHDGSIGPVSAILEKAKASKEAGAELLLVPLLQSGDVIYETEEHCEEFGLSEICTTETKPRKVNIKDEIGIDVVEVGSIGEALEYFFN